MDWKSDDSVDLDDPQPIPDNPLSVEGGALNVSALSNISHDTMDTWLTTDISLPNGWLVPNESLPDDWLITNSPPHIYTILPDMFNGETNAEANGMTNGETDGMIKRETDGMIKQETDGMTTGETNGMLNVSDGVRWGDGRNLTLTVDLTSLGVPFSQSGDATVPLPLLLAEGAVPPLVLNDLQGIKVECNDNDPLETTATPVCEQGSSTITPGGMHFPPSGSRYIPNFKVGRVGFWEDEGIDVSVNYAKPGTFATHGWNVANSRVSRAMSSVDITCTLCSQVFKSKEYRSHLQTYHKVDKTLLSRCFVCEKLIVASLYNMHLSCVHKISPALTASSWLPFGIRHDEVGRMVELYGDNYCELCDSRPHYASPAALKQHIKACHPPKDMRFNCSRCPSTFKTQISLANHMHRNHDHTCWMCQFCGTSFRFKKELKHHLDQTHNSPSNKYCHTCEKGYQYSTDYARHVREEHKGNGYFKCMLCGCDFDNHTDFKMHMCKLNL